MTHSTKLVSITKPFLKDNNAELTPSEYIAYVARVSNPSNQLNTGTSDKLLKYLVRNSHWSPFEMVHLTFEIVTTRDIGRQILRHRSFSYQEFSQRYATVDTSSFAFRDTRLQDTANRQNSLVNNNTELDSAWRKAQQAMQDYAATLYKWALDKGIAKEQARAVLPEGMTLSTMYMCGSVRSWIHYCEVRTDPTTQLEHRLIANDIWSELQNHFPSLKELDNAEGDNNVTIVQANAGDIRTTGEGRGPIEKTDTRTEV